MEEDTKFEIVQSMPIRDQVTNIIRGMVLRGEFKNNEKLSERVISQKLNVSVTPIKAAFRTLQSEGLIYTKPRCGSYVSSFSKGATLQIEFVLGALEGSAVYFAAKSITYKDINLLEDLLKEARELLELPDKEHLIEINNEFHSILRNACDNDYLINLISNLQSVDRTFKEISLSTDINEPARAHFEHVGIFEAVKVHDSDEAENRMVQHIRRIALSVIKQEEDCNNFQERGNEY